MVDEGFDPGGLEPVGPAGFDPVATVAGAFGESPPPAATLAMASADAPVAAATEPVMAGSSSTLDQTSLIGKIFIGFGALLTMASAARMFMA